MKWPEQVKELLRKEENDLVAAEKMADSSCIAVGIIGFHIQQAALSKK